MIKRYTKKSILCVDDSEVIIDGSKRKCYMAWNEGKIADAWPMPIEVLKETYKEVK